MVRMNVAASNEQQPIQDQQNILKQSCDSSTNLGDNVAASVALNNSASSTCSSSASSSSASTSSESSSTSSANTSTASALEPLSSSDDIVMVVPQQQQNQQQQQHAQPLPQQHPPQYTHMQHVAPQHIITGQLLAQAPPSAPPTSQSQLSPSDTGSNASLPATPPLIQQTPTPPQGAQLVPCAVHHPQQHQQHQQQMALVAAMQAHMAAAGGGPLPPHMHHHHVGPPPMSHHGPPHGPLPPGPPPPCPQSMENGHGGLSPSGSTASTVSSNSNGGVGNGGNVVAATAAPPPPPPGPVYIQYHGDFYPTEYYIAPHPHEGICPQHPHHHQAICAIPADYGMCPENYNDVYNGPTTVQMVSQNRPPPPMTVPVQVPQGQVVQPYVNESGTLTHVVLSPQQYQQLHAGQGHIHPSFIANGTTHYYAPMPNGFQPPTGGAAPYPVNPHGHMAPHQQPGTPQQPPPVPHQQQPPMNTITNASTQQQQHSPSSHSANHSPSPPNNNYHKDERTQRQYSKLLRKLEQREQHNSTVSSPNHSPSPRRQEPQMNGHNNGSKRSQHNSNNNNNQHQRKSHHQRNGNLTNYTANNGNKSNNNQGASSNVSSEEGEDLSSTTPLSGEDNGEEEDYQASIIEQLSDIQKPEVSDITSRSAKIVWDIPQSINESALQLNMEELRYNVLLSERTKECKYKSLYKGASYDCIIQDLKPGQDYVVKIQVHYEHLQGTASEPVEFATPPCEPERPGAPRLVMFTKNSLHLRWNTANCNGSPLQHYLLEYDEGRTGPIGGDSRPINFVEAVKTKGRQYIVTKLQPSTMYHFRLAAVNDVGPSSYSPICSFSTQGNPPSAPKPPSLQLVSSSSLRLMWERRQSDGATCIYVLQMLDRESGHGYLNMYNGPECSYECCQLRRATLYNFRLRAENETGASPWSSEVSFKTAPERPGRPGKPYPKGKIHGNHFRVRWEPPTDNGGAEIQRYFLEINGGGQKFERIYTGPECETTCDRLQPGTTYQLRASCEGPGGLSPYSEVSHITSEAVVPVAPPAPYYDNPPGPYAAVLRLAKPEYNGGAPILEYEVQLRRPVDQEPPSMAYRGRDAYCVIKDLQPGNLYEVQARAINRIGAGAWSPWFEFSSAAAPPNCPESLKVIVKSATQLHVTWQEPPNKGGAPISEYRLESATSSLGAKDDNASPEPPPASAFHMCYQGLQCSADLKNLLPFTSYYFRVNACNVAGMSKWSPLVNCQTPAAVPSAPQIKDYEFTSNEATLRWSSPESNGSPILNYTIEYTVPSNTCSVTTPDDKTEYTVSNLQPETTYKFKVQAINAIGTGPYSAYAKLTTLPSPPSPPTLECSGVGHNFIKLKWGDGKNLDFTKFYVEMYVQRAKEFQVVYTGTNCMCKVNKLQERNAYTFRICAGNDRAGVGEYSEEFVFTTSACLPSSIKPPRIAQNLPTPITSTVASSPVSGSANTPSLPSGGNAIPSGLIPETPSFLTRLGNLMLGVPITLEWQHSKNSFSDRVEYMLQYAIGKDGEFKMIYRGSETKFTIENLEPAGIYQFRVCPIRVTNTGEDLLGAFTSPFRFLVPLIPPLDDIDDNLLTNAAASMIASLNAAGAEGSSCHGHAHHHTHHHHHHNPSHHNSRHSGHQHNNSSGDNILSSTSLHQRSVSASAACPSPSSNMGFLPSLSGVDTNESSNNFAGCDDPNHHHHHHHHDQQHGGAFHNNNNAASSHHQHNATTPAGGAVGSNVSQTTASLLAASANQLFANNPILLQAATAAISHHQHILDNQRQQQHGSVLRRFVTRLSSVYTNRKRFSDQEKAAIFMLSFLFFTFLFATLVKMFMR
ncbi:miles to go [Haematobia irritans]|uniref:miles to go n=1 Tax=Haematobia irritans TaxID=7368 RepID=UPI003F4F965F